MNTPSAQTVFRQFRTVFKIIKSHHQPIDSEAKLSGAQIWALALVVKSPGLKVTDVADTMAIHQTTASNLVEKMVRRELLSKQRSSEDQRIVQLFPTDKGLSVANQVPEPFEGVLPSALKALSPEILSQLHFCLSEVIGQLDPSDESVDA